MKKLIKGLSYAICMLLLTCTFCHAQIEFNNDSIQEVIRVSSDSTKVKVCGAELLTIKMMVEYEKECNNDTTYSEGYAVVYFNEPKNGKQPNGDIIEKQDNYWVIKKAIIKEPTFKDFVRWAAKKYGL